MRRENRRRKYISRWNEKQIIFNFHFNYLKIQFKSSVSPFHSTSYSHCCLSSHTSHPFPIDSLMFKSCTCSIKHGDKWKFMEKLCWLLENGMESQLNWGNWNERRTGTLPSTQLHNNFIIFLCSTRFDPTQKFIASGSCFLNSP